MQLGFSNLMAQIDCKHHAKKKLYQEATSLIPQLPKPRMSSNAVALLGCVMTLSGAAGGTFEADLKKKLSDRRVHCARYVRSVWRYDFFFFLRRYLHVRTMTHFLHFAAPHMNT